eukprot:3696374-Pleurochrysis_carterae.AAC.1
MGRRTSRHPAMRAARRRSAGCQGGAARRAGGARRAAPARTSDAHTRRTTAQIVCVRVGGWAGERRLESEGVYKGSGGGAWSCECIALGRPRAPQKGCAERDDSLREAAWSEGKDEARE